MDNAWMGEMTDIMDDVWIVGIFTMIFVQVIYSMILSTITGDFGQVGSRQ